jgi:hypothetical protein
MPTFIAVYYSGMIITNEIGSYEFVGMKETFLLNEFLSLENLVDLVRGWLGWIDEGCEVRFEGQNDIGSSNGPRMKTMSPICKEEWTTYIGVMTKSKIHGIALVARMVGGTMLVVKVLGHQLCPKWLMSGTPNVALCLCNRHKKLGMTLMQMSPHSLLVMKKC